MNARYGRADGLQPEGGAAAWPAVRTLNPKPLAVLCAGARLL